MLCNSCSPIMQQLADECSTLKKQLLQSEQRCATLNTQCEAQQMRLDGMHTLDVKYQDITQHSIDPADLKITTFKDYVLDLLSDIPFLGWILDRFLSGKHKTKLKAKKTHTKWKNWSYFYQAWILDTFLRSRSPKIVRKTTLLLSSYMVLCNISEPCWRLLQRLKIVVSKDTVERWITKYNKELEHNDSLLFMVFDNCNFSLNVTKRRSDHKSEFLNIINQFIVEVTSVRGMRVDKLWHNVNRVEFGEWLVPSNEESLDFAKQVWRDFSNRIGDEPLKNMYTGSDNNLTKNNILILPPVVDRETLSYVDVRAVVDDLARLYVIPFLRQFVFMIGDQQVWIKLYFLRKLYPKKYSWLIPIPGGWHWTWHILKGIFICFHATILLPFAKHLGFTKLDAEVKNFHYSEDFLEIVTIAISDWIAKCLAKLQQKPSVTDWLHSIKGNRIAYELAYACIHYFIPYFATRSAIKWNMNTIESWWRYWTHLFIATKKNNYSLLSLRFLWILKSLDPAVRAVFDQHSVFTFSGDEGTGIALDGVVELVCTTIS